MTNKKQVLDYAFEEAVGTINLNSITKEVAEEAIATAMMGYAAREGYEFTKEEVHATIVAGFETLAKSRADFTLQTWTMK
ncbi:MAG: hypothetical protein MR908_10140 [Firmicutes bacterium]|nr:hypothetical protein [Bacillota bacterium]